MRALLMLSVVSLLGLSALPAHAGVVVRTPGGVYVNVDWASGLVIVDVKKKRRAKVKF